jgi:hypothetical protein
MRNLRRSPELSCLRFVRRRDRIVLLNRLTQLINFWQVKGVAGWGALLPRKVTGLRGRLANVHVVTQL